MAATISKVASYKHSGIRNWSAVYLKIGHFVRRFLIAVPLKCTVNLADQNGFWLAKC